MSLLRLRQISRMEVKQPPRGLTAACSSIMSSPSTCKCSTNHFVPCVQIPNHRDLQKREYDPHRQPDTGIHGKYAAASHRDRRGEDSLLTGRLTEGSADSVSTPLPSCRMCLHACSRNGVISRDSAVMPAQGSHTSVTHHDALHSPRNLHR